MRLQRQAVKAQRSEHCLTNRCDLPLDPPIYPQVLIGSQHPQADPSSTAARS
jgi:hypothetical protein